MNNIRHSLFAMAVRWPEVLLICGISTITQISALYVLEKNAGDAQIPIGIAFLTIATGVLTIIFEAGFLRTFVTDFSQQQTVGKLLGVGRSFFWRFFTLNLLAIFMFAITSLVLLQFLPRPETTSPNSVSLGHLSHFLPNLIFAKFLIFIPVIVLVQNCNISSSFKKIWRYKLLAAKQVLLVYAINLVIDYSYEILHLTISEVSLGNVKLLAAKSAFVFISQFFSLLVFLTASGFVMSVDMLCDTCPKLNDISN